MTRTRLVILGSGWAGFELVRKIDHKLFDTLMVSPRNHFVFTPLLASTSVGTLEFRSVTEPVRRTLKGDQFLQAHCEAIDLAAKTVHCRSSLDTNKDPISVPFDRLVIAVGALSNTFGIRGVQENVLFLKEISDAKRIRQRIIECFECATHPGLPLERVKELLHFCVVGGGPTGVEFSAELNDFIVEDVRRLYPDLFKHVKITVFDVASRILGGFDASLADYTMKKFSRQGIEIVTGRAVKAVDAHSLTIDTGETVQTGMIVWATGLAPNPLVDRLTDFLKDKSGRLLTDGRLNVLNKFGNPIDSVYALGDCATIQGNDLPCTAQVAKQKAKYLRNLLNQPRADQREFEYKYAGSMAYIGGWRAIADIKSVNTRGWIAWVFWRSAYFSMAVSWRNKLLIPMYWFLTWAFGRDVTKL